MDNENKKRISLEELYPAIKESLDTGGTVELPITGTSMLPLLVQGRDTVLIKKADTVKKGDIIFYRRDDGHFVLHRIVGKDANGYILCGDNQWKKEYGICNRHIIAVVKSINRNGKEINADDFGYRLYSKLWMLVLPIRKYILYISRKVFK
ncbi:MAG: S24/S26 family peptidase [Candidatus Fimenecus sp.]